jgi:hypothetical protein
MQLPKNLHWSTLTPHFSMIGGLTGEPGATAEGLRQEVGVHLHAS